MNYKSKTLQEVSDSGTDYKGERTANEVHLGHSRPVFMKDGKKTPVQFDHVTVGGRNGTIGAVTNFEQHFVQSTVGERIYKRSNIDEMVVLIHIPKDLPFPKPIANDHKSLSVLFEHYCDDLNLPESGDIVSIALNGVLRKPIPGKFEDVGQDKWASNFYSTGGLVNCSKVSFTKSQDQITGKKRSIRVEFDGSNLFGYSRHDRNVQLTDLSRMDVLYLFGYRDHVEKDKYNKYLSLTIKYTIPTT